MAKPDSISKKCILITGGAGYIGSHTVVEFIKAGYRVLSIDNLVNSEPRMVNALKDFATDDFENHNIDIRDKERVIQFFKDHPEIECVVHFAAFKSVLESVENPDKYFDNNVGGLKNVIEGMSFLSGQKRMVFSSSCTVYGNQDKLPVTESSPIQPAESPYGETKQMCERILEDCCKLGSLDSAVSLRYFNPLGASQEVVIGEIPQENPQNLLPFVMKVANKEIEKLKVFGNDYPTRDGSCVRDYIHVEDLADAHVLAYEWALKEGHKGFEAFNLGSGNGITVLELIAAFESATGQSVPLEIGPRRSGDVVAIYADSAKASKLLLWTAKRGLDEMVLSAWNWHINYASMEKA